MHTEIASLFSTLFPGFFNKPLPCSNYNEAHKQLYWDSCGNDKLSFKFKKSLKNRIKFQRNLFRTFTTQLSTPDPGNFKA